MTYSWVELVMAGGIVLFVLGCWAWDGYDNEELPWMTPAQAVASHVAVKDVLEERMRNHERWGEQDHPDGTGGRFQRFLADDLRGACDSAASAGRVTWRHILDEEVAEALAESDNDKLRAELVQVAAGRSSRSPRCSSSHTTRVRSAT